MKGDPQIIDILNEVLVGELTAINQYFLHARMMKDWGYQEIADKTWHESIDEMKHAQTLVDRVLFLEGLPSMQKLFPLRIGENVPEMLKNDLALEMEAIPRLKKGIELCYQKSDHTSREVLEHILESEEEHVDWLESQLQIISDVGVENYLSAQVHKQD